MAEIFKFFNSAPGDERWHYASDFADYFGGVLSDGILHTDKQTDLGLRVRVVPNTLTTKVSVGKAIIKGYAYENTTDLTLKHDIPEPTLKRIDRIVLRLDLSNSSRYVKLFVKKGASATSPIAPTLQRDQYIHELSLAQVLVRENTTQLLASDLKDERMIESLCGLVSSIISVPTTQFQEQWDTWFESVKNEGFAPYSDTGFKQNLKTADKTNLVNAINEVFISGNNVKKNMVDTLLSLDSTLPITINSGWSNIISALPNVSGKSAMNVFIQPTQPVTKDGIWFKTDYANRPEIENYAYQNYSDSLSLSTLTSPPVQIFSSSPLFHYKEKNMIILVFLTGNNVSIYTYDVLSRIYTLIYNADLGSGSRMYSFHKGYVYIFTVDSRAVRKIDVQTKMSTTLSYTGDLIPYSRDIFAEQDYLCVFLNGTLYKYDVKTNSVTKTIIATQPFANYSSASYFNGNLFVFVYANGFYHYNVQTNVWTKLKNNLPNGAAYTSLIANSQFDFYTLGGLNGSTYYSEIYKYDITEQIFKQVGNLSEKSNDLKAVIMENYIYVGGYYSPNVNVNKFERYAFDIGLIAGVNIDSINDLYKTALLSNKKYENLISIKNGFKSAYISLDGKTKLRGIDTYYGNGASWVLTNIK